MKTIVLGVNQLGATLRMLAIEEVEMPSMCAEFDPHAGDTYTVVKMIDFMNNTIDEVDWKDIRILYKDLVAAKAPKELKIAVWVVLQNVTPYQDLTAKGQRRQDEYKGEYPNLYSKYAIDIPIKELEELFESHKEEYGQNLNDWKMYNEAWRGQTESSDRERRAITELGGYIEVRKYEALKIA